MGKYWRSDCNLFCTNFWIVNQYLFHGSGCSRLYVVFAVNMLIKVIITFRYCEETRQGKIRMAETKNTSVFQMIYEYKDFIPKVLMNKEIVKVLIVCVILHIANW